MIIKDNVKNFKKFLETCYTKTLFEKFYTKLDNGHFDITLVSMTKSCGLKLSYTPKDVQIDSTLDKVKGTSKKKKIIYEDGELWMDAHRILEKMGNMRTGDVVVEFDGEMLSVTCGRNHFVSNPFASRDNKPDKGDYIWKIADSMTYDKDGKFNFTVLKETVLDHHAVVNSVDMKFLSDNSGKLSSASNYHFLVKNGILTVSVVDLDDKTGRPELFTTEFGDVEGYDDKDFTSIYMVGVEEMFANLPGEVDLYLGIDPLWPFVLHKKFVENIKNGKESVSKVYLDVSYMNMPYQDPDPMEHEDDLEAALEESDNVFTEDDFEEDNI